MFGVQAIIQVPIGLTHFINVRWSMNNYIYIIHLPVIEY